jgi:hypothetical protein
VPAEVAGAAIAQRREDAAAVPWAPAKHLDHSLAEYEDRNEEGLAVGYGRQSAVALKHSFGFGRERRRVDDRPSFQPVA